LVFLSSYIISRSVLEQTAESDLYNSGTVWGQPKGGKHSACGIRKRDPWLRADQHHKRYQDRHSIHLFTKQPMDL